MSGGRFNGPMPGPIGSLTTDRPHLARGWSPENGSTDPVIDRGLVRLGHAIHEARWHLGLSQRRFAERVGVDQPTISRLERGLQSGISLRRLARLLGAVEGIVVPKCPGHPW